jgi:hypothetical protein
LINQWTRFSIKSIMKVPKDSVTRGVTTVRSGSADTLSRDVGSLTRGPGSTCQQPMVKSGCHQPLLRLVPVVSYTHSLSLSTMPHHFSLSLLTTTDPVVVCTSLQHSAYSHISIRHINILLSVNHYSRLNYFRIHFVDNEFEKIIA